MVKRRKVGGHPMKKQRPLTTNINKKLSEEK
jgi:hypothetical protein